MTGGGRPTGAPRHKLALRERLLVALVVSYGLLATVSVTRLVDAFAEKNWTQNLADQAAEFQRTLDTQFRVRIGVMQGVRALLLAAPTADHHEFKAFVRALTAGSLNPRVIAWVPNTQAHAHSHDPLIEPVSPETSALLRAALQRPEVAASISRLTDPDSLTSTPLLDLAGDGSQWMVLAMNVKSPDAPEASSSHGFVLGFVPVSRIMDTAGDRASIRTDEIVAITAVEPANTGAVSSNTVRANSGMVHILAGDRVLRLEIFDPVGWSRTGAKTVGLALLLFTAMCGFGFLTAFRRRVAVERAEAALREGEARFRIVSGATPVPILITAEDSGEILFANPAAREMLSAPGEPLAAINCLVFWDDLEDRARLIAQLRAVGAVRNFRSRFRANGTLRDCLIMGDRLKFDQRDAVVLGIVDVTEQARVEARLRDSEARLSGLVEIAPEAIISIDSSQHIRLFNSGAEAIFGYRADEVMGQDLRVLLPERLRAGHTRLVDAITRGGQISRPMNSRNEVSCLRKDGSEFPGEAAISKFELGSETLMTVVLRDISQRKATEAALVAAKNAAEAATTAKSEFLANMSHELRTPLNAILGFSEMMQSETFGPLGDPHYREYAGDIHKSGTHLLNVINDVLDLAKIEAGQQELEEKVCALGDIVHSAQIFLSEKAQRGGVKLELELPDDLPDIYCDQRRIKQVLVNLLSNAVKFTPAGGRVATKAWAGSDGIVVQVTDTGVGMRSEDVPRAFAVFGQVDSGLNRKHEGTGLGLPLSRQLIEMHGGTIDLQSVLGAGTIVTVRLPAARLRRAESRPDSNVVRHPKSAQKRAS